MASPVTPANFQALIISVSSNFCSALLKLFLQLPIKLYQFVNWALDSSGDVSDAFRAQLWPAGTIIASARNSAPSGRWLECNGAEVNRTTYADLFSAIGTTFGVGDGSTTFNLPDARGRALVGPGTLTYDDASTGPTSTFGQREGEHEITLVTAELPRPQVVAGLDKFVINDASSVGTSTTLTGGGANGKVIAPNDAFPDNASAHDNVGPRLVIRYYVAY